MSKQLFKKTQQHEQTMKEETTKKIEYHFPNLTDDERAILIEFVNKNIQCLSEKEISNEELNCIEEINNYVSSRFTTMKYILGLAIDFYY
jgi:hypothetical protein